VITGATGTGFMAAGATSITGGVAALGMSMYDWTMTSLQEKCGKMRLYEDKAMETVSVMV
jgi:hypothetical protein